MERNHPFNTIIRNFSFSLLFVLLVVVGFSSRSVNVFSERVFFSLIGISFSILVLSLDKILLKYIEYPHYVHVLCICLLPIFMGIGSLLSSNITKRLGIFWALIGPMAILFFTFSFPTLSSLFLEFDLLFRMVVLGLLLFLIGITLGPFFPLGIKKSKSMPFNWLCNGLGAATGSFVCEWMQYQWGFQWTLVLCATIYAIAGALVVRFS